MEGVHVPLVVVEHAQPVVHDEHVHAGLVVQAGQQLRGQQEVLQYTGTASRLVNQIKFLPNLLSYMTPIRTFLSLNQCFGSKLIPIGSG